MTAVGTIPTLSQVRTWDTQHLTDAAAHWTETATVWEDHFTRFAEAIIRPGGEPWEGQAAEAAQQLAYSDKMTVIGLADQLHSASGIARAGATEISEAHRLVMRVVDTAEGAGFTVGEDFSVSDPNYYDAVTAAARQAQAEAIATELRATVGALLAADTSVAGQITSATPGLGTTVFPEPEGNAVPEAGNQTIQLVSSFKRDGGPTPTPPAPADAAKETVPFKQCVENEYNKNVGVNALKDGFKSAVTTAVLGAAGGGAVLPKGSKPIGVLGGGVLGFVGGFAQGVATSPAKTLAKAAVECSDILDEIKP